MEKKVYEINQHWGFAQLSDVTTKKDFLLAATKFFNEKLNKLRVKDIVTRMVDIEE